ncbi:XRE family transcriptional regulator [Schinkia azotoformans LMG 9581]|uniref:XRE family transcriptional regulator n=1 Tax=Schinkia azotoformans LMG 9581 TaxID=1131731 RepID=K6DIL8_SCHAZ|nr:XRE family transcriptional regulator [Schinkia azotoformans LMG 9581]
MTRQTINAIENNKYDPSLEWVFNLSYVLGRPIVHWSSSFI